MQNDSASANVGRLAEDILEGCGGRPPVERTSNGSAAIGEQLPGAGVAKQVVEEIGQSLRIAG